MERPGQLGEFDADQRPTSYSEDKLCIGRIDRATFVFIAERNH
jgi:hypothetical protein